MLRSKKVRSSRRLDEEWAAKEAEDEKSKKKIKKTRSSISLGKMKPVDGMMVEEDPKKLKASAPSKIIKDKHSSEKISAKKSSSSSSKSQHQKIKVQFEIVFVGLRNLPTKMHEDGSSVLVRWKSSTKRKQKEKTTTASGQSVRSKAETQAAVVKPTGRAGWEGVGSPDGETFVFEENLKYEANAKKFDSKTIELVLKEIKGKKKNHLYKLKVDVGEFAHNGSTTRKEIAFGGGGKSKDEGPILTVIFRARWLMIDNKVLVKKYGAGENGQQQEDYDLLTVDEGDMSESEAETDTDFSESESDMSESESDLGSDSESDSGGSSRQRKKSRSGGGGKKASSAELEKATKAAKKLEARCKQLETILLETKRELAEKKADNIQLQRQLKEKEDQLQQLTASSTSAKSSSGSIRLSGGGGGDLKKAVDERDRKIERLEASLKGKDDEIKAVKSLFQAEIEELKKNKKRREAEDDDDDDDDDGDDQEEEWQMKVDRAAALFDFKARNDQEISLTKDEEFYVTDRDPFGVGTFASEWWRVVRRNKDVRTSDASDPGRGRQEGLAPITYFRITRPAQKELSFKVSTKKASAIAELQRHCGFAGAAAANGGSPKAKKSKKEKKAAQSPTKKNESEDEDDGGQGEGDDDSGSKLKSLQKDRPMQSGKRLPSRFLSLRKKTKDRAKLGDHLGGNGDNGGDNKSSPGKKKNADDHHQQQLRESDVVSVKAKEVYITSDAETNRVLGDLQKEREWRDVIEKAVYCADFTQFVAIAAGPSFSSSSASTPTRAGAMRRSNGNKSQKPRSYNSYSSGDSAESDSDSDDSTSSSRSSRRGGDEDDDEREEKMLAGVHELVAYIKTRKVFEDPETSLSFVRPLRTALRATVQRSKGDFRGLASVLAFTTALLHCLKTQKNYLHLPPFSDDRDKFFQALFVDPKEKGIATFTEDVARRKKLFKLARKKVDGLTEAEERGLGSYKLIVRSLVVLVLEIYLALLRAVEKEIGPQMVPAMLEQPPDFFHLFMNKSKNHFTYTRPEEVMTQLTRLHSAMVAAGVWGAIIRQFFVDVYQAINARLFNAVIERSDLCTSANGFQIKTAISHLTQWADNTRFLDPVATKKQLAHITEVTSLLVLDMSVLSNESDVRDAFPTLSPKQLLHLASSFQPDSSSSGGVPRDALDVLKKMAARARPTTSAPSSPSLKLDPDVPPLVPTKDEYRRIPTTADVLMAACRK